MRFLRACPKTNRNPSSWMRKQDALEEDNVNEAFHGCCRLAWWWYYHFKPEGRSTWLMVWHVGLHQLQCALWVGVRERMGFWSPWGHEGFREPHAVMGFPTEALFLLKPHQHRWLDCGICFRRWLFILCGCLEREWCLELLPTLSCLAPW